MIIDFDLSMKERTYSVMHDNNNNAVYIYFICSTRGSSVD